MKVFGCLIACVVLVSCGANGAPLRPTSSTNLTVGTGGVSAGTNLGLSNGAFSVNLGQSLGL